jgi:hypothetical protein
VSAPLSLLRAVFRRADRDASGSVDEGELRELEP